MGKSKSNVKVQSAPSLGHNPYNRFGKTHNALAREFLKQSGTPENRALIADIDRFEADINDAHKWDNYSNVERAELQERALHDLTVRHWNRCAARKEQLSGEFDAFRESWKRQNKRDGSERLANMARFRTEIKLDPDKIEAELYAAAEADTPAARAKYDPDYLYMAAEHVADQGKAGTLAVARSALDNCHVSEPWLNTEKGSALASAINEVDVEYGLAKSDGGEIAVEVAELIKAN